MAEPEHLEELQKGVGSWNRWRDRNNSEPVDLSGADLDGAELHGCNLMRANLRGASLRRAQLPEAHLKGADFSGADIEKANFEHANARKACFDAVRGRKARFLVTTLRRSTFRHADLEQADFYRAYLKQVDFTGANLEQARLAKAYLERAWCTDANLANADLRGASLVQTRFDGADLHDARVYGVAAWSTSTEGANQDGMLISRTEKDSPVYVDNLNCAHLVSLMLDNGQVRGLLNSISSSMVLILGRFSAERKPVLDLLRSRVRQWGYAGVVFDFERPDNRGFIEVIKTLAGLARFVIADLTDPRVVHQEMDTILSEYPSVPVRPILKEGQRLPVTLMDHAQRRALVMPVYRYRDRDQIISEMKEQIIDPSEARAAELEAMLRDFMRDSF